MADGKWRERWGKTVEWDRTRPAGESANYLGGALVVVVVVVVVVALCWLAQ